MPASINDAGPYLNLLTRLPFHFPSYLDSNLVNVQSTFKQKNKKKTPPSRCLDKIQTKQVKSMLSYYLHRLTLLSTPNSHNVLMTYDL